MGRDFLPDFQLLSTSHFSKGVLLLDDMEGASVWTISGTGADYDGLFAGAADFFGSKGLRLRTRATDPAEDDYVQALRFIPFPRTELVVYRVHIGLPDVSRTKSMEILGEYVDGSNQRIFGLRYCPNEPALKYLNSGGTYTEISGYDQTASDNQWWIMELVVQFESFKYVECTFNGITTDLSAYAIQNGGASAARYHQVILRHIAAGAAQASAHVDNAYAGEYRRV